MTKIALLLPLALLLTAPLSHAAGDAAAGKAKSAACAGCHGADGNSVNPEWPKLAGQHADYLYKQLTEFKSGARQNALMAGQVAALNEQDMADLAAYYASLDGSVGEADPTQVDLGETIYRAGNPSNGVSACAACHGPTGTGNPMAKFPSLSGQHATYSSNQLKAFRGMQRANDPGQMMRNVAAKLTDAEIEAVAQYMQGLH
ncbi:MAG: c-type cytochrome [Gammaproteobacteria bacterium]|jgi:cytochrome c553